MKQKLKKAYLKAKGQKTPAIDSRRVLLKEKSGYKRLVQVRKGVE